MDAPLRHYSISALCCVLILLIALAGMSAIAQSPVEGKTIAPASPQMPAGQTKAVVDANRRIAKGAVETLTLLSDVAGAIQLRRRLDELKPQIEAMMPKVGGVL